MKMFMPKLVIVIACATGALLLGGCEDKHKPIKPTVVTSRPV